MPLSKDLREFVELLNAEKVDYVIIGAHALAFHGVPRFTGDIDIAIRPSAENASKMKTVATAFGLGDSILAEDDFLNKDHVLQIGVVPNRIDLIMDVTGISFDELWSSKVEATMDGTPVNVMSKAHLIRNKQAVGRPQDLADVDRLL